MLLEHQAEPQLVLEALTQLVGASWEEQGDLFGVGDRHPHAHDDLGHAATAVTPESPFSYARVAPETHGSPGNRLHSAASGCTRNRLHLRPFAPGCTSPALVGAVGSTALQPLVETLVGLPSDGRKCEIIVLLPFRPRGAA